MSIRTWKDQYYPVGASVIARKRGVTAVELIDHCLVKWIGARSANAAEHGVRYIEQSIEGDGKMYHFNGSNCALCQKYYDERRSGRDYCGSCPLKMSRDGVPCYQRGRDERVSPYEAVTAEPMIKALINARRFVVEQQ